MVIGRLSFQLLTWRWSSAGRSSLSRHERAAHRQAGIFNEARAVSRFARMV